MLSQESEAVHPQGMVTCTSDSFHAIRYLFHAALKYFEQRLKLCGHIDKHCPNPQQQVTMSK